MADILEFHIPSKEVDLDEEDTNDLEVDYAIYGNDDQAEMNYVSPKEVSKESIKRIKSRKVGIRALEMVNLKLAA